MLFVQRTASVTDAFWFFTECCYVCFRQRLDISGCLLHQLWESYSAVKCLTHTVSMWCLTVRVRSVLRRLKAREKKSIDEIRQYTHTHTHRTHANTFSHHTQGNRARIMLDIIFYLLLILFTSRCQFEWQVAEHFRVCLLASTWACQSLTAIHSVCGREAAPRWFAAVCLSWKCSASAGQERKRRGRGGGGGGWWKGGWGPHGPLPARRLEDFTPFHLKNGNVTARYIFPTIGIWASGLFISFPTILV